LSRPHSSTLRNTAVFAVTLLAIEFLDEFVFGIREAAWPLMRTDLGLEYAQIGLLLGLPSVASALIEPVIGVLGDIWRRGVLILGGGAVFALALLLTASSQGFPALLIAFTLLYPASGAFVTLSQATLMDTDPDRHEQNMARWALAGSLGVVIGPLALAAVALVGSSWRMLFLLSAGLSLVLLVVAWQHRPARDRWKLGRGNLGAGLLHALEALRRREVLRWLALLCFADLMMDTLLGFLALYMVDIGGAAPSQASVAVAVWTGFGLLGDLVLIPLLERVRGLTYLRLSAVVELLTFPAFLLLSDLVLKVALLGLLGLFSAGWYSILQAQLYSEMPGQSGTVMTVRNAFGFVGGLTPLVLGMVADRFGIGATMWLLLLGPIALLTGLPRHGMPSTRPV
jgi:FSR family fosmidomycin resistance protein-like MFS transporter